MQNRTGRQTGKHLIDMKQKLLFSLSLLSVISVLFITGCEGDENRLTAQDSADISEEAIIDAYYQDLDDLAGVVVAAPSDSEYSGGRIATTITINDSRFNCEGIVVTIEPDETSTVEVPRGVITVDFGTGCSDLLGNVRKGKLIFTYEGHRFQNGSSLVTTTENYYINDIKLEGTRTSVNVTGSSVDAPKFNVILEDGKATFEDGSYALRESNITVSWIREENPTQDRLVIHDSSVASGVNRAGRSYVVSLLKQLEYKRFCPMATSGTKRYTLDGSKEITIDYGSGSCDTSVTVTINGVTRTISIG